VQIGPTVLPMASSSRRDLTPLPPSTEAVDQIEKCRRGDRGALDEVFRAHADGLERLLGRLLGPRAEVEDLLQDTYSAAIAAFPSFRGEASVRTWLHRIAVNTACKYLRQSPAKRDPHEADDRASELDSPVRDLERRQLATRLYAHLDEIDAPKRVAFLLVVVEEMSIAEVAALTGASKAATKSRVFWARRALKRRLARDVAFTKERV
jgi:RNA polymerase sigma-70 factor (ECF subfamily)